MLGQCAWRYKLVALAALVGLACLPANADEPKSLALMSFELIDDMRALSSEQARQEVDRRRALIAVELAKELERRGMYRVACNGCDLETGKVLAAERVGLCWVQKVSNLILNINIEVRSVATGETLYVSSVDIRGNTDEAWLRGVRRLVDNIEERQQYRR
jgi:hypothetical protein